MPQGRIALVVVACMIGLATPRPAAAERVGDLEYRFFDESYDAEDPEAIAQGWVSVENVRTGDYAEAWVKLDSRTGEVIVQWEMGDLAERWWTDALPDAEYEGIPCRNIQQQNDRFGLLVQQALMDSLWDLLRSAPWTYRGGPLFSFVTGAILVNSYWPIASDIGRYTWNCYF